MIPPRFNVQGNDWRAKKIMAEITGEIMRILDGSNNMGRVQFISAHHAPISCQLIPGAVGYRPELYHRPCTSSVLLVLPGADAVWRVPLVFDLSGSVLPMTTYQLYPEPRAGH